MSSIKEMTCIICPNSCRLTVSYNEEKVLEVKDALCKKGLEYAQSELFNPMRSLTTTVKVIGGTLPLVSVRSEKPLPKEKLLEAVKLIKDLELPAPIVFQQVVYKNILDTGINIIATRNIEKLINCS